jgi:hypothetical protein
MMSGNAALLPDLPLLSGDQLEWLYGIIHPDQIILAHFGQSGIVSLTAQ